MKCPHDVDVDLVMSERQGVEIDYCPTCRGVWLDRGELDKIIDRSVGIGAASPPQVQGFGHAPQQSYPQPAHGYPQQHGYHKKKKREGLLGELFDFD